MAGDAYLVVIEGLSALQEFDKAPTDIKAAARQAVNAAARKARATGAERMMQQVAFPAGYLNDGKGRLKITKYATESSLEAVVRGRFAPTSLARYSVNPDIGLARRNGGVTVKVHPGAPKFMKRAFFIKLRKNTELTETVYNLGLALRLKPGEAIIHKKYMKQLKGNLYLLYGPSVDQVFKSVAKDITPEIENYLEKEFLRLESL